MLINRKHTSLTPERLADRVIQPSAMTPAQAVLAMASASNIEPTVLDLEAAVIANVLSGEVTIPLDPQTQESLLPTYLSGVAAQCEGLKYGSPECELRGIQLAAFLGSIRDLQNAGLAATTQ